MARLVEVPILPQVVEDEAERVHVAPVRRLEALRRVLHGGHPACVLGQGLGEEVRLEAVRGAVVRRVRVDRDEERRLPVTAPAVGETGAVAQGDEGVGVAGHADVVVRVLAEHLRQPPRHRERHVLLPRSCRAARPGVHAAVTRIDHNQRRPVPGRQPAALGLDRLFRPGGGRFRVRLRPGRGSAGGAAHDPPLRVDLQRVAGELGKELDQELYRHEEDARLTVHGPCELATGAVHLEEGEPGDETCLPLADPHPRLVAAHRDRGPDGGERGERHRRVPPRPGLGDRGAAAAALEAPGRLRLGRGAARPGGEEQEGQHPQDDTHAHSPSHASAPAPSHAAHRAGAGPPACPASASLSPAPGPPSPSPA
jgi:hypothetical protein